MSKSKKNPKCFSALFKRLICSGDIPTYPDHDDDDHQQITPSKTNNPQMINKIDSSNVVINDKNSQLIRVDVEGGAQVKPGIVARLMGLDSLPQNNTPNEALFFRSKSLNSLHFFPDFSSNSKRTSSFHRRCATASSFSHLGSAFSFKIDDEVDSSKVQSYNNGGGGRGGGLNQSVKKQGKRQKVGETNLKGNERRKNRGKQKYEEGYATTNRRRLKKDNVGSGRGSNLIRDEKCALLVQKKGKLGGGRGVRVHHNHHNKEEDLNSQAVDREVLSDSLSRSPVSVLDHHLHRHDLESSPSKEDESQRETSSSPRRKPTPKNKVEAPKRSGDDDEVSSKIESKKLQSENHKLKKIDGQDVEMGEYFVKLLGQITKLAEEHMKDPKWVAKSQGFKVHFVEELCLDFGGQILDLLLYEIIDEVLTN